MDVLKVILFILVIGFSIYSEITKGKKQAEKAKLAIRRAENEARLDAAMQAAVHAENVDNMPKERAAAQRMTMPEEGERVSDSEPEMVVETAEDTKPQMTIEDVRKAVVLEAVMKRVEW